MKVVIGGGSGFLGTALTSALVARGHDVVILSRHAASSSRGVRYVVWHPATTTTLGQPTQEWSREVNGADAIVNLAGAGIADKRWTAARKIILHGSRIISTRQLIAAVRGASQKPATFLQNAAIGFYGTDEHLTFDESSPAGSDFFAHLCSDWEREAQPAATFGCRLVTFRTGIVLARHGGALKKMLLPFQLGVGGPIASGRQIMSWIHLDDWIAMVLWALETRGVNGAINATGPAPVTNAEFTRALGAALHRPAFMPVPGFALRLLYGEIADAALINGQRVIPKRASELGFQFRYKEIGPALKAAMRS